MNWFKKDKKKKHLSYRYTVTPIIDGGIKWYNCAVLYDLSSLIIVLHREYFQDRDEAEDWISDMIDKLDKQP